MEPQRRPLGQRLKRCWVSRRPVSRFGSIHSPLDVKGCPLTTPGLGPGTSIVFQQWTAIRNSHLPLHTSMKPIETEKTLLKEAQEESNPQSKRVFATRPPQNDPSTGPFSPNRRASTHRRSVRLHEGCATRVLEDPSSQLGILERCAGSTGGAARFGSAGGGVDGARLWVLTVQGKLCSSASPTAVWRDLLCW